MKTQTHHWEAPSSLHRADRAPLRLSNLASQASERGPKLTSTYCVFHAQEVKD